MRLYLEGHNVRLGQAISVEYSVEEIRRLAGNGGTVQPVRFVSDIHRARRLVDRFNRRFGHPEELDMLWT